MKYCDLEFKDYDHWKRVYETVNNQFEKQAYNLSNKERESRRKYLLKLEDYCNNHGWYEKYMNEVWSDKT